MTKAGKLALAGFAAALPFVVGGCATTANGPQIDPVMATVYNQTGKTIDHVNYQECGAAADRWSTLPMAALPSGARSQFRLPAPCVNLKAVYSDGQTAGTQTGVNRDYPFQWTLR